MSVKIQILLGDLKGKEFDALLSPDGDEAAIYQDHDIRTFAKHEFKVLIPQDITLKTSEHYKECQAEKIRKITGLPCKKIHLSLTFE